MNPSDATKLSTTELCISHIMNVNMLAVNSGINPSTIRSILKSRCNSPNSQTLYYLCLGFGIELKDFFDSPLFSDLDDND